MRYSCEFMQFNQATLQDLDKIIDLAHKIWNDHYPEIIGQEQVNYMLNKIYDKQSLMHQMQSKDQFFIAKDEVSGKDLGFLSLKEIEEAEFFRFYDC